MAILCCSPERKFIARLQALVNGVELICRDDLVQAQKEDFGKCEVVIVDLKFSALGRQDTFHQPTIALAELPNFTESIDLLQRGVRGYGNRHMREINLNQVIATVKAGQLWLPPDILTRFIASAAPGATPGHEQSILDQLSEREREVACYVAEGMSNQEIADKLYVSLRTVKAHLSSIYEKTGLRNRLELGLRLK